MPSFRKLPSGKWQAVVYLPSGKRTTRTDKLKKPVERWAVALEAEIAQGRWRDPRDGRITIGEWGKRWLDARVVEDETLRNDNASFANHLLPQWKEWPMAKVRRLDVQTWVRKMEKDGIGPWAIVRVYNLFSSMFKDATIEGIVFETPCVKIHLPKTPRKQPAWFTREQVTLIEAELPDQHAAMVELMVHSGPRWGEVAGCVGADRDDEVGNPVDWLRGRMKIRGTLTQRGQWKPYPKSAASCREVPVPRHVLDLLSLLMKGRDADGWVFISRRRSRTAKTYVPLSGPNWRNVWYAAIEAANVKIEKANRGLPKERQTKPVPAYDPHDCRHTAATWLVQAGVPIYDVKDLLGHESVATTEIYAHHAPDKHDSIEMGWSKIITHVQRIGPADTGKAGR